MGIKENLSDGIYSLMVRTYSLKTIIWSSVLAIIVGIILTFSFLWLIGTWDYAYDRDEYKKKTKENEKIIQSALASAEKNKKEADAMRAINQQIMAQLDKERAKKDSEVKIKDEQNKSELQEIQNQYVNDINSIKSMDDEQRRQDICARIAQLANDNPGIAQYQCGPE